jgi:hypothetical protein
MLINEDPLHSGPVEKVVSNREPLAVSGKYNPLTSYKIIQNLPFKKKRFRTKINFQNRQYFRVAVYLQYQMLLLSICFLTKLVFKILLLMINYKSSATQVYFRNLNHHGRL